MKRLFVLLLTFMSFSLVNAQVKTPAPSPSCSFSQDVGLTTISIDYSRPGVKDRTIFGDLVPYNEKWRTGANRNTTIEFSTDVNFGGTDVPAGKYALYSTPGMESWEVYLYNSTDNGGLPDEWNDAMVVATAKVPSFKMGESVETMLLDINSITNNSASLDLVWESTYVSVPLTVPTDKMVMETIDKTMAGPASGDYYNAARYMRESGKDLDKALTWMDKSIEMSGEKFWMLRQKALLLADMGKKDEAIKTIKRSTELAQEADYQPYIKMNAKTLAEWGVK